MSNHVHWVVVPEREDSLEVLFRRVHGRYAQYLNARRRRIGHLWQNRFFSFAVAPAGIGTLGNSNSTSQHFDYDAHGNVLNTVDASCITTTYTYDTTASDQNYMLYPISIIQDNGSAASCTRPSSYASLTRSTTVNYEFSTGLELSLIDPNGVTHSKSYDALGRVTFAADFRGTTGHSSQTNYSDANRRITTCHDLNSLGDYAMVDVSAYDQMGRPYLTGHQETANSNNSPIQAGLHNASKCTDTAPSGILQKTLYSSTDINLTGHSYTLSSNPTARPQIPPWVGRSQIWIKTDEPPRGIWGQPACFLT